MTSPDESNIDHSHAGEMIVYRTEDGHTEVQLRPVEGTVWLTQAQMAELYDTSIPNVNQVIRRILDDGEVTEATINSELMVRQEGGRQVRREVKHYNLDMVLAVGYRVTTPRAVQFRQWASTVLHEYLIKGFAMNDARLKDPQGVDYFDELLKRIREIRASEQRFYAKVRELFKVSSVDYDANSAVARNFFATIQNKLLFAVTGMTAGEVVVARCNAEKPDMGLTSYKGSAVRKADVSVAKNYLSKDELDELERLTVMFLDYAEDRSLRREQIRMADWVIMADKFIDFNEREVLRHAGRISHDETLRISAERYAKFDSARRQLQEHADDLAELEAIQSEIEERKRP
ncbi:hydroxyacid dehydrogenase [Nocardia sp. Root136]|uniref:virulence RhuM family protein n=1 Tax=Nocardia sp. Root136 TaxID=1736458 RepID=UPI0006F9EE01|nr:virulence RhuM family protein [Nocardia sp. Root136]KQY30568.1 hydroxyacid dehydrogenase [Nocardia sp. Root136]